MTIATDEKKLGDLKDVIEGIVRDKIKSGKILSVKVDRGENFEGEGILAVTIIFETAKRLDAGETAALTRYVRQRLFEIEETRFPFFSYLSKKDAGDLAAA